MANVCKRKSKLLNLTEVSEEFIQKIKEEGFNGVYCHAYTENTTDPSKSDGEPQEILDRCNRHYCIFVIEPEFDDLDFGSDSPYVSQEVDVDGFWRDMQEEMRRVFGRDVEIKNVGYGGCEWEVIRKEAYKKARSKFNKWWEAQKSC